MPKQIAAIACARNEADIIEAFVRHTLAFADRLTVVDHGSIDGTPDILAALRNEGLPLEIRTLNGLAQRQAETLNALLLESAADWIVPLDVDEFLTAPGGSVRDAVAALSPDAAWTARMLMYAPDASDPPGMAGMRKRLAFDKLPFLKVVAIPAALRTKGLLSPGNHAFLVSGKTAMRPTETIVLRHVPLRSTAQVKAKALGWINHLLRENAREGEAKQWQAMFKAYMDGELETLEQAAGWALGYSRYLVPDCPPDLTDDPMDIPPPRYAGHAARLDPRLILADLARQLGLPRGPDIPTRELARTVEKRARWLREAEKHIDQAAPSS